MAIEIERKFLVADDGWRAQSAAEPRHYRQAYLAFSEHAIVRVRLEEHHNAAWLCLKQRRIGASRAEFEYAIPISDARDLLQFAIGEVVEKTRYLVPMDEHIWEVDEFMGANAGLLVAEIELGAADEAFLRPPWLGAEVTHEERYYNANLALKPFRDWEAKKQ